MLIKTQLTIDQLTALRARLGEEWNVPTEKVMNPVVWIKDIKTAVAEKSETFPLCDVLIEISTNQPGIGNPRSGVNLVGALSIIVGATGLVLCERTD